jgi:transposase
MLSSYLKLDSSDALVRGEVNTKARGNYPLTAEANTVKLTVERGSEMPPVDRNNPTRAGSSESEYSLMEFMQQYPDDSTCLEALWRKRYALDGEHAYCPKCETERVFRRYVFDTRRQAWNCIACGFYLYPTAGTIFHKSSTSLHLWFYGMYLMASTQCRISAKQLERELGVTYKTAWRMARLIRHELMEQEDTRALKGRLRLTRLTSAGSAGASLAGQAGMTSRRLRCSVWSSVAARS